MGKNKERLNSNNIDLSAILADLKDMPSIPKYTCGTTDLTADTTKLETGRLHFVYNTADLNAGESELKAGSLCFIYE